MRKISKDEFDGINGHGRGSSGPFFNKLLQISVGESFVLEKSEWKKKYPPTTIINRVMKNYPLVFKWKILPSRDGWAILREK